MKQTHARAKKMKEQETLTEAYEVRAFRDEAEDSREIEMIAPEIPHADVGALQAVKSMPKGHGEQMVLPDDCQFGDNDLCYVES
jgi:hypothetical protein